MPGKLIFRFEADAEHFLAKIKIDRWKEKLGLEIFFGKGMPSVIGQHPDGSEYRLEGMLGEPPDWLIDGLRTPTRATRKAPAKPSNNGHMPGVLRGDETAKSGDETVVPGDEGTPPDIETAPFDGDGDATLAALRADLAEADPELGKPSVGWWTKDRGGRPADPRRHVPLPLTTAGTTSMRATATTAIPTSSASTPIATRPGTTSRHALEIHTDATGATLEPPRSNRPRWPRAWWRMSWRGSIALHCPAPTGSGKSHALDQAAVALARMGEHRHARRPTVRTCGEHMDRLKTMAPDLVAGGAVAEVFGLRPASVPGDEAGTARSRPTPRRPPRGLSRLRHSLGSWSRPTPSSAAADSHATCAGSGRSSGRTWTEDGRAVHRPAFHLLVDEASE